MSLSIFIEEDMGKKKKEENYRRNKREGKGRKENNFRRKSGKVLGKTMVPYSFNLSPMMIYN